MIFHSRTNPRVAELLMQQCRVPRTTRVKCLLLISGTKRKNTLSLQDQDKNWKENKEKSTRLFREQLPHGSITKTTLAHFSSSFLKISLHNQCQHFVTQMSRKLLLASHPQQRAGFSKLEVRTLEPLEYKIDQNLKYQCMICSVQQTWNGTGKDRAFTVFTERT